MDENLISKAYKTHTQNLKHCEEFRGSDLELSAEEKEFWGGKKDAARLPAVHFFKSYVKKFQLRAEKLLTFGGGNDPETKALPYTAWVDCDYWNNKTNDVEDLSKSSIDKDFDFCLINQTFEHLTNIEGAIKNVSEHLRPGGYMYANWPVLNIPHAQEHMFFTGITVQYIICMCLKYKLKIAVSGQWGSESYINYIYRNLAWPSYTEVNMDNDIKRPCIGWVLAQKQPAGFLEGIFG